MLNIFANMLNKQRTCLICTEQVQDIYKKLACYVTKMFNI